MSSFDRSDLSAGLFRTIRVAHPIMGDVVAEDVATEEEAPDEEGA